MSQVITDFSARVDEVDVGRMETALLALKAIDASSLDRVDTFRLGTAKKLLAREIEELKKRLETAA